MVEGKKIEEEVCIHKFDGCTFGGCFGPSGCRHVLIAENKSLMERVKTLEKTELSEITSLKAEVEKWKNENFTSRNLAELAAGNNAAWEEKFTASENRVKDLEEQVEEAGEK